MKIIFLDIDGVLVTGRSHIAESNVTNLMQRFDEVGCRLVRQLCIDYDTKIVISSTWRTNKIDVKTLKRELSHHGMLQLLHPDWRTPEIQDVFKVRGDEILLWNEKHPGCSTYVIFDDDEDFLEYQKPFLVQTSIEDGISYKNYLKACDILKNEKEA